jgi:hypothetical protein
VSAAGAARTSVALLSLGGGTAAGVGLPAAVGAISGTAGSSSSGGGGSSSGSSRLTSAVAARGSIMSAGRASVCVSQQQPSPYANQAAKAASVQKAARKSQVGLQSGAVEADTAAAKAQ